MSEKNILGISKLYQRGKAQIPSEVRKVLGLKDGDRVYFTRDERGRILLEKAPALKEHLGKY